MKLRQNLWLACIFLLQAHCLSAQLLVDRSVNLPSQVNTTWTMDAAAHDLDGDGDLELILANEFRPNLVLFNDGQGVFTVDPARQLPKTHPSTSFSGEDSEDVAVADFNLDGYPDLLFVSEDSPGHELLMNDGTGLFTPNPFQFPTSTANALAVADLNGDALPDVIIGNNGQNQLYINLGEMPSSGALTFLDSTQWKFPINTDQSQDLKWLDFDNDGDMDLIEGAEVGGNNLFLNDGHGNFTEASNLLPNSSTTLETRKVTVGDVNGDSLPDIFCSNVAWVPGANPQDRLYLQALGSYSDQTSFNLPVDANFTLDAAFVDLNQDGHLDLIKGGLTNLPYLAYYNDGNGFFSDSTARVFPPGSVGTCLVTLVADFNGDGLPDVFFGNHQQRDALFLYDNGATGRLDPVPAPSLRLFPNPATHTVHFHTDSPDLQLQLIDQTGSRLPLPSFQHLPPTEGYTISLTDLSPGVYFVLPNSAADFTPQKLLVLPE